jgi:hypothetical protein
MFFTLDCRGQITGTQRVPVPAMVISSGRMKPAALPRASRRPARERKAMKADVYDGELRFSRTSMTFSDSTGSPFRVAGLYSQERAACRSRAS